MITHNIRGNYDAVIKMMFRIRIIATMTTVLVMMMMTMMTTTTTIIIIIIIIIIIMKTSVMKVTMT